MVESSMIVEWSVIRMGCLGLIIYQLDQCPVDQGVILYLSALNMMVAVYKPCLLYNELVK